MTHTTRRNLHGSVLVLVMAFTPHQSQAITWLVSISVTKTATGAPNNYELAVGPPPNGSFIAPDGTVMRLGDTNIITGLSQADITSRFAGQWTINDHWNLPPGQTVQQHHFSISGSALTSGFDPTPIVISPAEGAVVPPVFDVKWQDNNPGGSGFRIIGAGPDRERLGDDHYRFTAAFQPGEREKTITFYAQANNTSLLPAATPVASGAVNRFPIVFQKTSRSFPRSFTAVVPEPAVSSMAAMGLAALFCARGHKAARVAV